MKNMHNKTLGNFGEDAAEKYLKENGYDIIARNYRCRGGEVDIIVKKDDCLVFVEVKTRKNSEFGAPAEAVDFWKIQKIEMVANFYLSNRTKNPWIGDVRIDVIEVFGKLELGRFYVENINHIENVVN